MLPTPSEILKALYGVYLLARRHPDAPAMFDCSVDGFWRSLFAAVLVLPAHNCPCRELRARVSDLRDHHVERLEITHDACATPATGRDVMKALFTRELDAFQTRFAIGETVAHINNLLHKGELTRDLDEAGRFRYGRAM